MVLYQVVYIINNNNITSMNMFFSQDVLSINTKYTLLRILSIFIEKNEQKLKKIKIITTISRRERTD